jgi:hypothetical protein
MANVQEKVILHNKTFYLGKICAETWNFSLPKKLDLRKTKLFRDQPSSFCSRYPNIYDRTKKMDYIYSDIFCLGIWGWTRAIEFQMILFWQYTLLTQKKTVWSCLSLLVLGRISFQSGVILSKIHYFLVLLSRRLFPTSGFHQIISSKTFTKRWSDSSRALSKLPYSTEYIPFYVLECVEDYMAPCGWSDH